MLVIANKQDAILLYKENLEKDFMDAIPPFTIYQKKIEQGDYQVYFFKQEGQIQVYMIFQEQQQYVLMLYFAVMQGQRGKGIGTKAIEEIKELYKHKKAILIEVENGEKEKQEEALITIQRRIQFYQRLGFQKIEEIEYSLKEKPYDIMILGEKEININEIKECFEQIYHEGAKNPKYLQIKLLKN